MLIYFQKTARRLFLITTDISQDVGYIHVNLVTYKIFNIEKQVTLYNLKLNFNI